jgi:hypothetical protein
VNAITWNDLIRKQHVSSEHIKHMPLEQAMLNIVAKAGEAGIGTGMLIKRFENFHDRRDAQLTLQRLLGFYQVVLGPGMRLYTPEALQARTVRLKRDISVF